MTLPLELDEPWCDPDDSDAIALRATVGGALCQHNDPANEPEGSRPPAARVDRPRRSDKSVGATTGRYPGRPDLIPPMTTEASPYAGYLRTITFRDYAPTTGLDAPVHVTSLVLLDGEMRGVAVKSWSIIGGRQEATLVELVIPAHDCTAPMTEDTKFASIGGIPVLTPVDSPWSVDPDGWVTARFYVRSAQVIPAVAA